MINTSNETLFERLGREFPSDAFLRKLVGPAWRITLERTFLTNLMLYRQPMLAFSDVGLAEARKSGALRLSLNPIRWMFGFPYVLSYVNAFRTADVYADARREVHRLVFDSAVRALRCEEYDHDFAARVPFIAGGAFVTFIDGSEDEIHRRLVLELQTFLIGKGELRTGSWILKFEGADAYLETSPAFTERKRIEQKELKERARDFTPGTFE